MKSNKLFLFLILLILLSSLVSSQNDNLPIGLKKIIEYNKSHTQDFAFKVSLFIAFLAGTLGILSPCILPFLPVYFALTFKEKVNITKMTIIFFLGFSLVFVSMGIIAGMIGSQVLSVLQKDWVIILAGLFLISMGLLSFFGKGFSSIIKPRARIKNDKLGIFLLGLFFALGWTACLGPILAGILGIGAILGDISKSAILLFFYSIGNFVPLFLISILYDKINFEKFISKFKPYKINIGNKKLYLNPIN
ncbi:cytochrome c biogenesis protein CcdA, partial [Candidatus Woesearchaeota archaeon]